MVPAPHGMRVFPSSVPSRQAQSGLRRVPPLLLSLLLLSAAVGSVVLIGVAAVALVPLLVAALLVAGWLVALVLLGWAAIEALAALERWFESDTRFQR